MKDPAPPILLYDGVCNLCNASVRFILRHERAPVLKFVSLQSEIGQSLLQEHGFDQSKTSTLVLIQDGQAHIRSAAALRASSFLKAPWRWLQVFLVLPRPLRDATYRLVARFRYRLMGKTDECQLPSESERERFLDAGEPAVR